jgi:enamine deaminase RidA (YjgF/YER057c/UK114 family)
MELTAIQWNEQFSFAMGVEASSPQRVLMCAGQIAIDASTMTVLHPGDMRGQISAALDSLESFLGDAGYQLSDVVRLNYYTTDVDEFMGAYDVVSSRLRDGHCQPASTLLGVNRLVFPDTLVEIEATAVK